MGEKRKFFSTLSEADGSGILVRQYTGQIVEVIKDITAENAKTDGLEDEEREEMFVVKASDGVEFEAWAGELNDFYKETRQYYFPE